MKNLRVQSTLGAKVDGVIHRIIAKVFPTNTFTIHEVQQGHMTLVYKIVLDTGKVYYFRASNSREKSFEVLSSIHSELLQLGAKIPKVYTNGSRSTLFPMDWMIVAEIMGRPFRSYLGEMTRKQREEILSELFETMKAFWKYTCKGFGHGNKKSLGEFGPVAPYATNYDFLLSNFELHVHRICSQMHASNDIIKILDKLSIYKRYLKQDVSVFCHGDLSDKHIMVENGKFTGVIDLDEFRCSSIFYDFAYLYSYLQNSDREFVISLYHKFIPHERFVREKLLITNVLIAVNDIAYMMDDLHLDVTNHQHVLSIQENLPEVLSFE